MSIDFCPVSVVRNEPGKVLYRTTVDETFPAKKNPTSTRLLSRPCGLLAFSVFRVFYFLRHIAVDILCRLCILQIV